MNVPDEIPAGYLEGLFHASAPISMVCWCGLTVTAPTLFDSSRVWEEHWTWCPKGRPGGGIADEEDR
jgi:hypothetical protein